MRKILVDFAPGIAGGIVGGLLGFLIVYWIRGQGFYAPVLPGALAGLGTGLASIRPSRARGVVAALIALGAVVLTEWKLFSPPVDIGPGLLEFVANYHREPPLTLAMTALGAFLGFWWGREATCPWRHRFADAG